MGQLCWLEHTLNKFHSIAFFSVQQSHFVGVHMEWKIDVECHVHQKICPILNICIHHHYLNEFFLVFFQFGSQQMLHKF